MKLAFGISYNGCSYFGWQNQPHTKNTVRFHIDHAISKVANQKINSVCAGRTDSGVHSTGQVIHVETDAIRKLRGWQMGTNKYLPKSIRVDWVKNVADSFHARFSANYRRYQYIIADKSHGSAIFHGLLLSCRYDLNAGLMHQASQCLLGKQDFTSFRASRCQSKTAFRNVQEISVYRFKEYIVIDIRANAFLYHMVRNIVGALLTIGQGKESPEWMLQLLSKKDRRQAPSTAPSQGLYLVEVGYEDIYEIPQNKIYLPFS